MKSESPRSTSARSRLALGTALLLVVAGAAGGLAWFGIVKHGEDRRSAELRQKRVVPFEPRDVVGLRVRLRGEEARLERKDGRWKLLAPVEADADAVAVDQLLSRLSGLERRARSAPAGEPAERLREYGLTDASTRIEVALADGSTLGLTLGESNGFDGTMFVQPASGEVQVVGAGTRMDLEKTAFELRERRLLRFEPSSLERIEVAGPRGPWSLAQAHGGWTLAARGLAEGERADPRRAEDVVAALRALQATAFEDGDPPAGKPAWEIHLAFAGGGEQRLSAWRPPGGGEVLVVRAPGQEQLARLPTSTLGALDVDPATLRDRRLLPVDREQVTSVRLEVPASPADGFTLTRTPARQPGLPDEWKLTAPAPGPAEPWKAQSLLFALTGLEAERIEDESGRAAAQSGLAPAARTWVLVGADGKEIGRLAVGRESRGELLVRSGASPRIWAVKKEKLDGLPKGPKDLAGSVPPG